MPAKKPAKQEKRKSTRYAITLARLDPKTGKTIHNLSAGHDDFAKFNRTDLQPFLDAFAENDRKAEENARKWAEHEKSLKKAKKK